MPLQLYNLLSKGYFPKELPPPFTTVSYSQALSGAGATPPTTAFSCSPKYSPPCIHNLVRTGGLRRNLAIPNPKHFFRLAEHVVTHWTNFTAHTYTSPFSLTKPIETGTDRAISPENELSARAGFRANLRATKRYLLKADISRFFPSIYTHSIPWAVMGKSAAKAAHASGTLTGTWSDMTDLLSRSIFNNQTIGIPIGPDTSRLIAELILSRIDIELADKFPQLEGIRYIDDYEFAFATRSAAEEVLSHLQHLLNDFELALNTNKTMILDLPDYLDPPWTSKIRVFVFRDAGITGQRNDLTAYFDMIFDFFRRYPEEGLMKYAIARLRSEDIKIENWPLFESLLNHCVLVEPACIPQVIDQITYYKTKGFPIRNDLWFICLNSIVSERILLGQSSEAAWAMWLMKLLGIGLQTKSANAVGDAEDSIAGIMALGLASIGLAAPADLSALNRFSASDGLFENQWLLCYQGNLMECLGPSSGRAALRSDPAFAYLEAQNVTFFDIGVVPPVPIRHTTALGLAGGGGGGGDY